MPVSEYFPEEKAVGPHKKFMMFFTDNEYLHNGEIVGEGQIGFEFISCTMLCSTWDLMERVISQRPEVLEFRNKWNKEITAQELEDFVYWACEQPDKQVYHLIFTAVCLALKPFYDTDKNAKDYINWLAKSHSLMKFVAKKTSKQEPIIFSLG